MENKTIKVPIKDIHFEESEKELNLVNKELEDLEITNKNQEKD